MAKYFPPKCMAFLPYKDGTEYTCNREMTPLAERDPSFGPNYRPGMWVFQCKYCGAFRAVDKQYLDRYLHRR